MVDCNDVDFFNFIQGYETITPLKQDQKGMLNNILYRKKITPITRSISLPIKKGMIMQIHKPSD